MSKLVQIMRTLRSMPPLPDVASRGLGIQRNPEYSIDTLVSVVRTDPALTTRILKLAQTSRRTLALVWGIAPGLLLGTLALALLAGLLPVAMAWVGKRIVDVLLGAGPSDTLWLHEEVVQWVLIELGLVALQRAVESRRTWRVSG